MLLLGHRGDCHVARENTIAAFDVAIENGCDGFEFDVRLTADFQAIVVHDAKVSGVAVAKNTFRRLETLDGSADARYRLPRFKEVVARYAASAFLDIEVKVPGLESILIAQLKQSPPRRGYVVSSFHPELLLEIAKRDSSIPLGLIAGDRWMLSRRRELPLKYVIPKQHLVRSELVEECHRLGRKLFVWTVNSVRTMRRMAELGVDGIISDNTKLLVETLKKADLS
ncbi:MAG: glycerophosphodiester phosphodiesterase [Acidobacteria bacterium]|nr:glycerophosphodiester phosphodiesterase [Acidobacteriota bacterium]